jgi:HEAT repeat protein
MLIVLTLLASLAHAGAEDRALAAAADPSPEAILRLGVARDTESIPILEPLAEERPDSDQAGHAARLALARLGETRYEKELLKGLSKRKPPAQRLRSLRALGYVADRAAIKKIAPLLKEKGEVANTAAEALGDILPVVQTRLLLSEPLNSDRAGQWQRWWNDFKDASPLEYDQMSPGIVPQP